MLKKVKTICVVVSDINNEYQNNILKGIKKYANEYDVNIGVFCTFTGYHTERKNMTGEFNIYNLINFEKFEGVILVTNTITNDDTQEQLFAKIRHFSLPTVSINFDIEDFYSINIDNERAMENIVTHVVEFHKKKRIAYISGPFDNPEAILRLKAFRAIMAKNKLTVDERHIFHGRFLGDDGKYAVKSFISAGLPMPEAIICANDEMALTAILELEKNAYNVPEDVIVTGFDNIYAARTNFPKITSVEAPLLLSGYHACKKIAMHYAGTEQKRVEILSTLPIFTESCGCHSEYDENTETFKRKNFINIRMFKDGIDLINRMLNEFTEVETFDATINLLKEFVVAIKCEKCFLCLNVDEKKDVTENAKIHVNDEYLKDGYSDVMQVALAYSDGKFTEIRNFRTSEMLPDGALNDEGLMYFFSPIHYQDRCIGYIVIGNSSFPIESQLYYSWLMSIGVAFENIRKITALNDVIDELDKLYITDQLCGIYNRHGFEKFTKRIYKECIARKLPTMIMFIDLDGLKFINDTYGHNHGDIAISKMASELKRLCRNGEICARLGGDEYVIFAADYTTEKANFIISEVERRLDEFNATSGYPYKIAGSMGYCLEIPNDNLTIDNLIKVADDNMYQNKLKRRAEGKAKARGEG